MLYDKIRWDWWKKQKPFFENSPPEQNKKYAYHRSDAKLRPWKKEMKENKQIEMLWLKEQKEVPKHKRWIGARLKQLSNSLDYDTQCCRSTSCKAEHEIRTESDLSCDPMGLSTYCLWSSNFFPILTLIKCRNLTNIISWHWFGYERLLFFAYLPTQSSSF